MKKTETEMERSRPTKQSEMDRLKAMICRLKKTMTAKAAAATTPTARSWATGDVVEARSRSWWRLATVWGPAARSGYYWLRFFQSSEVVCVPASTIRPPRHDCASWIRDVELEAILTDAGCERDDAAARRGEEEEEEDDGDDARSVSSSVGSNDGGSGMIEMID